MDPALSLDPLIAEAKLRMRKRRLVLALLMLLVGAVVAFALRPFGSGPGGSRPAQSPRSSQALAQITVPVDSLERHWRTLVRSTAGSRVPRSRVVALRQRVVAVARATGTVVVRIRIWRTTAPPAVEVVLATNVDPALYLRHRAGRLVHLLGRPQYVKVVDTRGARIFEWGGAANEGFVGVAPALRGCGPVFDYGPTPPPCPVK